MRIEDQDGSRKPVVVRRYPAPYLCDLAYGLQRMPMELAEAIRRLRRDHSASYVQLGYYLCETDPDEGASFGLGKALTEMAALRLGDHDRMWI
jgi:hypothetical protein